MDSKIQTDFEYGHIIFKNSTAEDDMVRGIDGYVGNIKVATRKYRTKFSVHKDISIRRRKYSRSEYEKILDNEFEPKLYLFEFEDCYIACRVEDIAFCLKQGFFTEIENKDGITSGCYINTKFLPHLHIDKIKQEILV